MRHEMRGRFSAVTLGIIFSGATMWQSPSFSQTVADASTPQNVATCDGGFGHLSGYACDEQGIAQPGMVGGCDSHATLCQSLLTRQKLTGDWLGRRSALAESGFSFDVSTTQYYQGVASGGVKQGFEYGGRNDYFLNVDGEKAGLWKGAFITLHGETRYADSVNPFAGALLPPNLALSLPVPRDVTALTGVKFTQFLSESSLVYAGKINTFDDFKQPLTGAGLTDGFMNGSLMINPIVARTVPYSTFGAGFAKLHNMEPVFTLAVFDTNNTPTVSGFDTFFDNGATIVSSLNLQTGFMGLPGHQGILGIYSTGDYTNLSPTGYFNPGSGIVIESAPKDGSWALGYNFDQAFYVSPTDPRKRWGIFGNLGIADDNPSPIRWTGNLGLAGTSPIAGRSADTFGVGYYYTGLSGALKDFAPVLLPLDDEQGGELYYRVAATPWCQVTPNLQLIEPFRSRVDSSLLVGLRARIDF